MGKRTLWGVLAVLVVGGLIAAVLLSRRDGAIAVTTAKADRQDIVATVSGDGQIKPRTFVNIGATSFGRITHLFVKEGDHVKRGDVLAQVESVQPQATVSAQQATIAASRTDVSSYAAAENTATANVAQAKADLEQKTLDFRRSQQLYESQLIAKQDFDAKKAAYDMAAATLEQRQAAVAQAKAQTASARGHLDQAVATQRANYDALDKTISRAPFDGLVTNVPVREGETVVVGIQNAEGSTLMTLADLSVITAEVKVDETDIVNVKLGQPAEVAVDAMPGRTFKGRVTEVGDQALLRTTGMATSQSTTGTEEAKDFKVVVTLDPGQDGVAGFSSLRPGLSASAKITTATRHNALTIPIQALVLRDPVVEDGLFKAHGVQADATKAGAGTREKPVEGVFLVQPDGRTMRARFVPVSTGVNGASEVEILGGLSEGQEVATGRYKVLRTLKSGVAVKQDTAPASSADNGGS